MPTERYLEYWRRRAAQEPLWNWSREYHPMVDSSATYCAIDRKREAECPAE